MMKILHPQLFTAKKKKKKKKKKLFLVVCPLLELLPQPLLSNPEIANYFNSDFCVLHENPHLVAAYPCVKEGCIATAKKEPLWQAKGRRSGLVKKGFGKYSQSSP